MSVQLCRDTSLLIFRRLAQILGVVLGFRSFTVQNLQGGQVSGSCTHTAKKRFRNVLITMRWFTHQFLSFNGIQHIEFTSPIGHSKDATNRSCEEQNNLYWLGSSKLDSHNCASFYVLLQKFSDFQLLYIDNANVFPKKYCSSL